MNKGYEDLKETAPCGMLIHYTVDGNTDMITYTDINGQGKECEECKKCSWRGICKPQKEEHVKMSKDLYTKLWLLLNETEERAKKEREQAEDTLTNELLKIEDIAARTALERLKKSTKKIRETKDLIEQFEKEIEYPTEWE